MLSLVLLVISSALYVTSGAFIDFHLTTADPNHLTLECFSSTTGDVDLEAIINSSRTGSILSGSTFDVTPMNEGFLNCTSGNGREQSNFVAIAGKLQWYKQTEVLSNDAYSYINN